jgi:Uncharacterized protein conserved in bacteria (DUF2314)
LPTLEIDGWGLESAEERHAAAPASFDIPSREERAAVPVGRRVKLLFLFMNQEEGRPIIDCERMWVTVTSANDGQYTGRLESSPASSSVLSPGDVVTFGPEHIATVLIPKTDPTHPEYRAPASWWRRLWGG